MVAAAADHEKELMLQATYGLWLARNNTREGPKLLQPHEIIDSLKVQLSDWNAANETRVSQSKPKIIQKWEPPVNGRVKINSDGAVSKQGTNGGGGAVFRDHNAMFLSVVSHFFPRIADPNIQRAHLELDSRALVVKINHPDRNLSAVGPWVQDIKTMLNSFDEYKVI
ncbi:hypothetical protein D1007_60764 [Hordeum vulgare]|nr:hypothetical protein D1007_60764 [Hordeum vulgare]